MSEFKWFRSLSTGKTGRYPAHYGKRPSFVEIDPETAQCLDCMGVTLEDDAELDFDADEVDEFEDYTETEDE